MPEQITPFQFMLLVTLFTIGTTILVIPSTLVEYSRQDAWMSVLVGMGMAALLIGLYCKLAGQYPDLDWVALNEKLLGRWLGAAFSLFWVLTALISLPEVLYYMGQFLVTQIMPETPALAFNLIFTVITAIGVQLGIVTLGRAAQIFFPVVAGLFLFLLVMLTPEMRLENLQPVLTTSWSGIMHGSILYASYSAFPLIFLLMIFPSRVSSKDKAGRAFIIGSVLGNVFLLILTTTVVLVIGDSAASEMYPSYVLAKKFNVGGFITRLEVFMAAIWFITLYCKLTLYFYAGAAGLARVLRVSDYRVLVVPLAIIAVILSISVYPDMIYQAEWDGKIWPVYVATSGLLFPALLLLVSLVRNRLVRKKTP
ncbi:GerAB/ArcD/ProY family transporter [Paenibacillus sp. BAC0078]